jgi:hypothetical protein
MHDNAMLDALVACPIRCHLECALRYKKSTARKSTPTRSAILAGSPDAPFWGKALTRVRRFGTLQGPIRWPDPDVKAKPWKFA